MLTPSAAAPTLRVALYRTSSLGDVVLASACLDLLAKLPMPTEITWIGRGASLEVLTQSWPEVRGIELGRTATLLDLQKVTAQLAHIHLLIDLQCNLRSQWLARNLKLAHGVRFFAADKSQLTRSRLLVEARLRGRRKPLPEKVRVAARLQFETMCDALRRGLRHHLPVEMRDGIDDQGVRPRLPIPDAFDRPWRKELRFGPWLGVAPGAAHATKQAPLNLVGEILNQVRAGQDVQEAPLGLVFLGDANDRNAARALLDQLQWSGPVLNLAGRLSLWETGVALKEVSGLLTNDSSLSHIAEAVDTPTAVLFGPTVEAFGFAPRMRQSHAFSTSLGCRPCSKHGKLPCRYDDQLCFATINPADVARHLLGLLSAPEARHKQRGRTQASAKAATSETPVVEATDGTSPP